MLTLECDYQYDHSLSQAQSSESNIKSCCSTMIYVDTKQLSSRMKEIKAINDVMQQLRISKKLVMTETENALNIIQETT